LSFYLDTNAVYSYIFEDAHSTRIDQWIDRNRTALVISDWLETEFCALVHRRLRDGGLTAEATRVGMADFDVLARERTLRLPLSAADALHLALSAESGHCLVTFDIRLANAAKALGFAVETP
jgi:predicted nucleic acid-binding protein